MRHDELSLHAAVVDFLLLTLGDLKKERLGATTSGGLHVETIAGSERGAHPNRI